MRPFARQLRRAVLASSALSMLAFAPTAFAQEEGARSDSGDNEIIVTARRRDERLIDAPVAITAVSGDTLENYAVSRVTDLATLVPSMVAGKAASGRPRVSSCAAWARPRSAPASTSRFRSSSTACP